MDDFAILTNRKRALIALAHSIVFLGIALRGFTSPRAPASLRGNGSALSIGFVLIYLTVAFILIWLANISRCLREKMYFGFCACSATFGLLRVIFGDAALPAAQYLRVVMLSCAVVVGTWILRSFLRPVPEESVPD